MEKIMEYLLRRKKEILSEGAVFNHGYHNQGHLDIINELEEKINNGAEAKELDEFACSEIEKSEAFIAKEDEEYGKLSSDDKKSYEFTSDYFITDGRMCQCMELQTFLEEE